MCGLLLESSQLTRDYTGWDCAPTFLLHGLVHLVQVWRMFLEFCEFICAAALPDPQAVTPYLVPRTPPPLTLFPAPLQQ